MIHIMPYLWLELKTQKQAETQSLCCCDASIQTPAGQIVKSGSLSPAWALERYRRRHSPTVSVRNLANHAKLLLLPKTTLMNKLIINISLLKATVLVKFSIQYMVKTAYTIYGNNILLHKNIFNKNYKNNIESKNRDYWNCFKVIISNAITVHNLMYFITWLASHHKVKLSIRIMTVT